MSDTPKRVHILYPRVEYRELLNAANKRNISVTALIRILTRIGLDGLKPNASLVLREEGKEERTLYIA